MPCYGSLSRSALNKGAVVISNDLSENQLFYNLKHITTAQKSRLYLNTQDIRELSLPENALDLIIFHRVLPFLKGNEIDLILKNAFKWIKPNGKIYIVMMSKNHVAFRDKINYNPSKKWPGQDLVVVKEHLPDQAYALPQTLHVVSHATLEQAVKRAGFHIVKIDYVSMKRWGWKPIEMVKKR